MRKVIGIGETVLDIIFKNDQPVSAVPGGSVFNGLISLGRSGIKASLISETGNDRVGRFIINFLEENGVDSSNVYIDKDSKSPLSLAFLNEKNDAEYIFYKDHPNDKLDFIYPEVNPDDVVMFGSFYAVNPVIRQQVAGFLEHAKSHGAIIYYDVNFRPSHRNDVMKITPNLLENLELCDIVRGSSEDFEVLFGRTDADKIYRTDISFYTHNFIFTQGAGNVELRAEGGISRSYPVEPIETVSTIGAGDNFNAGFVYGLMKQGITREQIHRGLSAEQWDRLIASGQMFARECCKTIYNYITVKDHAENY
ncbi:MAG: carbohydrate kinase [Prevotella sp.]